MCVLVKSQWSIDGEDEDTRCYHKPELLVNVVKKG